MMTDPFADMLTRIRNAALAMHDHATLPASKLKIEFAKLLEDEGYISGWSTEGEGRDHMLTVNLKYDKNRRQVISGPRRVSKPGRRVYVGRGEVPKVLGGMGVAVISTSQGLLSGQEARRRGIGGEVLCEVW